MKRIFSLIILSISLWPISLVAQRPYNDAIKLRAFVQPDGKWLENDKKEIAKIFANYCSLSSVPENFFLGDNPFIESFSPFTGFSGISGVQNKSSFLSSVGGLDVTNAVDGLARFLVERTKQELSIAFFDRLKNDIDSSKELQTLFPQTSRTLKAIDKEIYQFNAYLNTLRQVFAKDMANLYTNIKKYARVTAYKQYLTNYPEIKTLLENAFYFVDAFSAGMHPGNIIADYNTNLIQLGTDKEILTHNLQAAIQLLKVFSASFESVSPDHYWVPPDSLAMFFSDKFQRELFFGILYHQCKTITFKQGNTTYAVSNILGDIKKDSASYETKIKSYVNFIQTLAAQANELQGYLSELKEKQKAKDTIDFTDYYNLYQSSAILFQDAFGAIRLPGLEDKLQGETADKIAGYSEKLVTVLTKTSDLFVDIRTKQYASAIINAVDLLHEFDAVGLNQEVTTQLLKYGSFIANVSSAKNPEDVQAAIEAIAAPVGSSRVKRLSKFNVSLNAYTGLAFGKEWINGVVNRDMVNTRSVTAPVGIAFSWGDLRGPITCHTKAKGTDKLPKFRGHSFTAFISLIDIGAVTAIRFGDNGQTASKLPEITLQNIIAPGVFVSWGIKKMPISLSAGYQNGPLLRDLNVATTLGNNFYQRFILSVNVDIPLLNLHTKTK